jgi:hypothetical protein
VKERRERAVELSGLATWLGETTVTAPQPVSMNPPASPFRVRAEVGECRAKRLVQDEGKSGQLFRRH